MEEEIIMKTITRLFSVFISAILVFMLPVQILASTFESQSVDTGEYLISTDNENMKDILINFYSAVEVENSNEFFLTYLTEAQAQSLEKNEKIDLLEDNKIFNYCKLNNFKNYTKAARFVTNVNGITDNDWKSHSTVSLV